MTNLLIRNVPERTVAELKQRAKRRGRSLQAEALAALEAEGPHSGDAFAAEVERLHSEGKLHFSISAALEALYEDYSR